MTRVDPPVLDAYIGLGSNLGDPVAHLRGGLAALARRCLEPLALSSVWETEPVEAPGSDWFLNMVVRVRTALAPADLLATLLAVEREAGRVRTGRNDPRTLDLDLLLLGDLRVERPGLSVPHPRMWERRFVLEPLAEIAPRLRNPETGRTVAEECLQIRERGAARRLGNLSAL
jgi:2-amino-4-hydroxy-6-hydroxymethyldihydropteridine diphosphokinase